jgi:ferrous iron transport protein B
MQAIKEPAARTDKKITVALAGNPNAGKTCCFNALTGARQQVGNWPGVTVEKKEGVFSYKGQAVTVVDLPGTYGLAGQSEDETIAREYILSGGADVVVNVVDATNLERSLYLTTQLLELGTQVVIALNMYDDARSKGINIDVNRLSELLVVPIIPTVAPCGEGIEQLIENAIAEAERFRQGERQQHILHYGVELEEE